MNALPGSGFLKMDLHDLQHEIYKIKQRRLYGEATRHMRPHERIRAQKLAAVPWYSPNSIRV
jgi:hypothetical protein